MWGCFVVITLKTFPFTQRFDHTQSILLCGDGCGCARTAPATPVTARARPPRESSVQQEFAPEPSAARARRRSAYCR